MKTVPSRAGGIPRLFVFVGLVVAASMATPAHADQMARTARIGDASWYGPGFHGRRTASGERYDAGALTAAHRTLPLGTQVRITNLRNGRSVMVTINDRGPYHGRRVIDLSRGAASEIGMVGRGVERVLIEPLI